MLFRSQLSNDLIYDQSPQGDIYAARYRKGIGWQGAELISNESDDLYSPAAVLQNNGNAAIGWVRNDTLALPTYTSYFGRHYWTIPGLPIADAGLPQYIHEETAASLDGSRSYDPDGVITSYLWTQVEGPPVVLASVDTAAPTFTTPVVTRDTLLRFELLVTDNDGLQARITTSVQVLDIIPPVANAGPDQTVNEGVIVYHNGSASTDEDGFVIAYSWVQVAGPPVEIFNANSVNPIITAPAVAMDTPITLELKVTDDEGISGTDQIIINVVDIPGAPVANAGPNQAQPALTLVLLDGTASSDADGTISRYSWLQESGPSVTLNGKTIATPTFSMPNVAVGTTFVFSLTVWDNNDLAATDLVQITTSAITQPPVANAGLDMTYSTNQSGIVLNGVGSTDPDGTIFQYDWVQLSGATVILMSDQVTPTATFTSPATPGTLTFELTVTDDGGLTATDQVVIEITQPVTINLTANPNPATRGATVTLDATGSIDPDGTIVSYAWTQSAGPAVTLSGNNTALASFTAPVLALDTVFTFDIAITDSAGLTVTGSISVTVLGNQPPQVNAGIDQTVNELDNVTLTGSATDPEAGVLTYLWTQTTGPAVTLTNANTASTSFTAPAVTATTTLGFLLTVTDDEGGVATDAINVTVNNVNVVPTANAGPDQTVNETTPVTLAGSGTDTDGTIVSYAWVQTAGPVVTLTGANTASASFTAPSVTADTTFTFQLTVTDNDGGTGTDLVNVIVQNVASGDTTPPITTDQVFSANIPFLGQTFSLVILTANEPGSISFRLLGNIVNIVGAANTAGWQPYQSLFLVTSPSSETLTLEYFATDTAGNIETTKIRTLP